MFGGYPPAYPGPPQRYQMASSQQPIPQHLGGYYSQVPQQMQERRSSGNYTSTPLSFAQFSDGRRSPLPLSQGRVSPVQRAASPTNSSGISPRSATGTLVSQSSAAERVKALEKQLREAQALLKVSEEGTKKTGGAAARKSEKVITKSVPLYSAFTVIFGR